MKKDIIIIGAGLTGLTLAYYLKKAGKNVLIIEKENKTGGVIKTEKEGEFTYETGPSTGVIGSLEIAELFEELNEKCNVEIADKAAQKRYILKKNRWVALPSGLFSAIGTPLFTWYDKFRILGEPFRKPGTNPNESVADLVKRRLGKSYLNYAVDPFVSGVYAGNPDKLITRFALPKLYYLEQNYGSFISGSIKKAKEPKAPGSEKVTRKVFSMEGGLEELTKTLTREIGNENIVLGAKNAKINPSENLFLVSFENIQGENEAFLSSNVVTTAIGSELPDLLPFIPNETIEAIKNTAYADVVQAAVGFKKWNAKPLDGFGGLIPGKENKDILGILYPSAIFKGRAPKEGALLSVFMGGSGKPEMLQKTDEELKKIILNEIHTTLGEQLQPDFIKLFRHKNAIAQYDISTEKRLEKIEEIEKKYEGLYLAGSIRDGIGMADRVKQARQLAKQLS